MAIKPDLAGGYQQRPKEEVAAFWEEAAVTLNSMGPPTKTAVAWKKVSYIEIITVILHWF